MINIQYHCDERDLIVINRYELQRTGAYGGFPEQYDVIADGSKIGSLELRGGCFKAAYTTDDNEKVVFEHSWHDDNSKGNFSSSERAYYLSVAVYFIDREHQHENP